MRLPFKSFFKGSPLNGLHEHGEKVKECAWVFQQAVECYAKKCKDFEKLRQKMLDLKGEADAIKAMITERLPKDTKIKMDKFKLYMYLNAQDGVLNAMVQALGWMVYKADPLFAKPVEKGIYLLVDAVIETVEELTRLSEEARKFLKTESDKNQQKVQQTLKDLEEKRMDADRAGDRLKHKMFAAKVEPDTLFYQVRLAEAIGNIPVAAGQAGVIMSAMLMR